MSRLPLLALAAFASLVACGQPLVRLHSPPVVIPQACVGDDSVYHLVPGDTTRGFRMAHPIHVVLPRDPIQGGGHVRFIVDQLGIVDASSIVVDSSSSNAYALEMFAAAGQTKYIPATRLGCAVKSWSGIGFVTRRP